MTQCPLSSKVASYIDEQLVVTEMKTFEEHLERCDFCNAQFKHTQSLINDIRTDAPMGSQDDFLASVMQAIEKPKTRKFNWYYVLAASFVSLFFISGGYLIYTKITHSDISDPQNRTNLSEHHFAARGPAAAAKLASNVSILPLVVTENTIQSIEKKNNLSPKDGLTFRYTNIHSKAVYFMAFAIDRANDIHWFYPAYVNEQQNPKSIELQNDVREHLLPDIVQPENVPTGNMEIIVLVSDHAYSVKQVESMVARKPSQPVSKLFSKENMVKSWHITYSDNK